MTTDLKVLDKDSNDLIKQATELKVTTQLKYDEAARIIKNAKHFIGMIKDEFKSTLQKFKDMKAKAEEGRKDTIDKIAKHSKKSEEVISILQIKCKAYENEEAEKLRKAKEKSEKEEKEKAEKKAKEIREKADVAKEWEDNESAEELEKEAEEVVPKKKRVASTIAKNTGLGITRKWQWKITNEKLIPKEFYKLDEVAINNHVRANKDEKPIKGIEIYYD